MTDPGDDGRDPRARSVTEEAAELVEAVREWSASPEVRARLATAATSLLEAGAALLDTVAARQRSRSAPPDAGAGDRPPAARE